MPVGASLGIVREHADHLLNQPFPTTCIGRVLAESVLRAQRKFQHSVTNIQLEAAATPPLATQRPADPFVLLALENALVQLPLWCVEANAPLQLYLQIGFPTLHARTYAAAAGWSVITCENDQLIVRHSASGVTAFICDEPAFLLQMAKENTRAPLPFMVLQPHANRIDQTTEIIRSSPLMPRLFTAWVRADMLGSAFRRDDDVSLYGSIGPPDDLANEVDYIVRAMTNHVGFEEAFFQNVHRNDNDNHRDHHKQSTLSESTSTHEPGGTTQRKGQGRAHGGGGGR